MAFLKKESHSSQNYSKSGKFRLPCKDRIESNEKDWLQIINKLSANSNVLKGLLDKVKSVIVKYDEPGIILHEYSIAEELKDLPNFIKYYCNFVCKDSINALNKQEFISGSICKKDGDDVGFIIMPYYELGNIYKHRWTAANFHILKNIYKQVACAIICAYKKYGFIHNDLHALNILLRKTKKTNIVYEEYTIDVEGGYYALIMDFGRSCTNAHMSEYPCKIDVANLYDQLYKLLNTMNSLDNTDIAIRCYTHGEFIEKLVATEKIPENIYELVCKYIDNIKFEFEYSKINI